MSKRIRSLALVGPLDGHRRVTHTAGFPIDPAKMPPAPDVILLVGDADPGAMLFRYTAHGEFGGDTWHASEEDARAHAVFEYGDALLLPWMEVPDEIADAHRFASDYARERLNDRGRW